MDRRFLTVLGISLLFALIVSSIFYQVSARVGKAGSKPQKTETTAVVVAGRQLPIGVTIQPEDVKLVQVPKDLFPSGGFAEIGEVVGRPVISSILAEEPVLEGRLADRGSGFGLSPVIPVGMRAVSVKVNEVVGVAGYVLPGMRVDVLVTVRLPGQGGARTTTVLQNIIVLSAGHHIQPDGSGKAIDAPVVTLLVTPEQAEILTLASSEGRIQLVLRNAGDQEMESPPGRDVGEFYGRQWRAPRESPAPAPSAQPRTVKPVTAPPQPPPPPPDEVVVIRGTQKSVEVVGEHRSN
jgi:pilus assembly protein CpaB